MIGTAGWLEWAPETEAPVLDRMLSRLSHRGRASRTIATPPFIAGIVGGNADPEPRPSTGRCDVLLDGWIASDTAWREAMSSEPSSLAGLRGEFALVVWDRTSQRLMIARDPVGVRPVYVFESGRGVVFASEIGALLAHPRVPRELDVATLAELFGYRYTAGSRTPLRGIQEIPPGWAYVWSREGFSKAAYWDLPYRTPEDLSTSRDAWLTEIDGALRHATREALAASRKPGVLLSGGLDSSLVAALGVRDAGAALTAWSVGSPDPRLDESDRARFVAGALGIPQTIRPISPEEFESALPEAVAVNGEPLHHPNSVALHLVARDAAGTADALMMGEGADSSFGNRSALKLRLAEGLRSAAPAPVVAALCRGLAALGAGDASQLADIVDADPLAFTVWSNLFTPAPVVRDLLGLKVSDPIFASRLQDMAGTTALPPIPRLLYYYQKTEMVASFNLFGHMLAGAGVEARMPFGSRLVQEVSCRIPVAWKAPWSGTPKPLLVRLGRSHLPPAMLKWPKMSFGFPMSAWLRKGGALEPWVRLALAPGSRAASLLDGNVLRRIVEENERGVGNHGEGALFMTINLEIWIRVVVEGESPDAVREAAHRA